MLLLQSMVQLVMKPRRQVNVTVLPRNAWLYLMTKLIKLSRMLAKQSWQAALQVIPTSITMVDSLSKAWKNFPDVSALLGRDLKRCC